MTTKIVSQNARSALVAGLSWHPLVSESKKRAQEIRTILADSDVTKIAMSTTGDAASLGLFLLDEDTTYIEGQPKPGKLFSLALAFAAYVSEAHANAVLAYQLPGSPYSVIVLVEGGKPVLDDIKLTDDIQNLVSKYANGSAGLVYEPFTNDLGSYPNGEVVTEETLWKFADKNTLLINKPVNVKALLILLVVVAIAVGGGFGYQSYAKAEKRKAMMREAALNDPVAKYEEELVSRIGALGMTKATVQSVITALGSQPVQDAGWKLKSISCTAAVSQCTSLWARNGGTTQGLVASRSAKGEELSPESSIDESRFTFKMPMPVVGVATKGELPEVAASERVARPIYQVLANARVNVNVQAQGYKTWPPADGVPPGITVKSMGIEIKSSTPLATQAILALPGNFWWSDIQFEVTDAPKDASNYITLTVKGNSYVR